MPNGSGREGPPSWLVMPERAAEPSEVVHRSADRLPSWAIALLAPRFASFWAACVALAAGHYPCRAGPCSNSLRPRRRRPTAWTPAGASRRPARRCPAAATRPIRRCCGCRSTTCARPSTRRGYGEKWLSAAATVATAAESLVPTPASTSAAAAAPSPPPPSPPPSRPPSAPAAAAAAPPTHPRRRPCRRRRRLHPPLAPVAAALAAAALAAAAGCVMWRQTARCSASGPREPWNASRATPTSSAAGRAAASAPTG